MAMIFRRRFCTLVSTKKEMNQISLEPVSEE